MDRVASTMRAIEDIAVGRLAPDAAKKNLVATNFGRGIGGLSSPE